MLIIPCPYCGPRDEIEFACGGEAHIARPRAENTITDAEFADYLFIRDNPKGVFLERWRHSAGCRRWFNVARDTVTHEILEVYPMGSTPKKPSQKAAMSLVGAEIRSPKKRQNPISEARAEGWNNGTSCKNANGPTNRPY